MTETNTFNLRDSLERVCSRPILANGNHHSLLPLQVLAVAVRFYLTGLVITVKKDALRIVLRFVIL